MDPKRLSNALTTSIFWTLLKKLALIYLPVAVLVLVLLALENLSVGQ
jgi:hypothetical protein